MLLNYILQFPVGVLHRLYRVLQWRQLDHLTLDHRKPAEDAGKLIRSPQNRSLNPQTGKVVLGLGILQILWRVVNYANLM